MAPGGISATVSTLASTTLGEAVALAPSLTASAGADLLDAAQRAFSEALDLTASIYAIIVLGTAIVVAVMLRERPSPACRSRRSRFCSCRRSGRAD